MCPWDTEAPADAKFITFSLSQKSFFLWTKGNNFWMHNSILTIIQLEEDIFLLNNVTKFHEYWTYRNRHHEKQWIFSNKGL